MTKSPCKNCEMYKNSFPKCMDSCDELKDIQQKNMRSFDYHLTYEATDYASFNFNDIKE